MHKEIATGEALRHVCDTGDAARRRGCGGVAAALAVVYVTWGSTFVAMRVAVRELPPLTIGYLIIVGSVLGYSTYEWLLHHASSQLAGTYAFVCEIHDRYGPDHLVSRSIRRATPMILRAVEQVQDRTRTA